MPRASRTDVTVLVIEVAADMATVIVDTEATIVAVARVAEAMAALTVAREVTLPEIVDRVVVAVEAIVVAAVADTEAATVVVTADATVTVATVIDVTVDVLDAEAVRDRQIGRASCRERV